MKHTKLKITKMLNEILNYLYYIGATDISAHIKEEINYFEISIESDYKEGIKDSKIEKIEKNLLTKREESMEEYYWELAGECDVDCDLVLVGMMCDFSEVKKLDNNKIKILVRRNK
ncbi:MAG: hypothetical protein ACERKV_05160 [Clostridiaceae bacterium]